MAINCPAILLKISSGVEFTNVETQSQTVVTGLAAILPVTPSPPPPDMNVRS